MLADNLKRRHSIHGTKETRRGTGSRQIQLPRPVGHRIVAQQGRTGEPDASRRRQLVRGTDCQSQRHFSRVIR